jgi:branched-chain amino acid transport system substrate-binding protein
MSIRRRTVLQGMLATTAAVAMPAVARAQGAPFKLGLMTVKTGPLAQGGIQMEQGIATFLKEKNGAFGSRKVELLVADTGGNPAGAKTKAQELIERDKVDVILGPLAAFELLAITDYVRERQTPMLSLAAAEDVTQRKVNPWVIRPAASSGQCSHVMADYAAKEMGLKRMATISEDFAFGHEQCAAFQRVFEDTGGKIVKKLWPPLVTPDYTPYIAQIGDVDGVFNGFAGSNPVKFMRSYADLGLKAKIPLTAGWTALDDALLKSVGDEAVGVISATYYTADHDSPSNKRFVAAMAKDYGVPPGAYSAAMYVAGQCVEAALGKTGAQRRAARPVARGHAAWPGRLRRGRQRRRFGVRAPLRAQGRHSRQHHDQDLPEGQPVLDLPAGGVPEAAGLFARLPAGQEPAVKRAGW